MPVYEYRCNKCSTEFERLRAMADADRPGACPQCGAADSRRLLSEFGSTEQGFIVTPARKAFRPPAGQKQ